MTGNYVPVSRRYSHDDCGVMFEKPGVMIGYPEQTLEEGGKKITALFDGVRFQRKRVTRIFP